MELHELLNDLTPEELEPRLELQILTDPIASAGLAASDTNNNCRDGGTCQLPPSGD
ncbi:MAG TPA: hypothetical protein VHU83_24610 [Bryobacteraceae bacterium]|jgi:hypothetical protein|nr:hypothetical protein [Bryobacteraceae bacterium]